MKWIRVSTVLLFFAPFMVSCSLMHQEASHNPRFTPSQNKQCHEIKRRLMMGRASINGDRTSDDNNQLQQLQSEYRANGCE